MEKTVDVTTPDEILPHRLPAGTVLNGRYLLQKVLGQGGFGITYLAWDNGTNTWTAVKEFYPQSIVTRDCAQSLAVQCMTQSLLPAYAGSKARFLREARALERFRDIRTIVGIQDYFEENNTAYIVMEYINGISLEKFVDQRGGRLTVEETLRILEPVFQALIAVHREGFVHRDISPDNILLDPREGARLLDFGAVRHVDKPSVDKGISVSTEAILKHGFAPVEQYNTHGALGPWTDEYALCATVYYCLTGEVPKQVTLRITDNEPLDWASVPDLLPYQKTALEKGIAIRPNERYRNVEQLYRALYNLPGGKKRRNPEDIKPIIKKAVKIAAATLALGVCIFAGSVLAQYVFDGAGKESATDPKPPETTIYDGETIPTFEPPSEPTAGQPQPTDAPQIPTEQEPDIPPPTEEAPDLRWMDNVMTRDPLNYLLKSYPEEDINEYIDSRRNILSITFLDSLSQAPDNATNLGENGSDLVKGWYERDGEYIHVYIGAEGGINGSKACRALFAGCANVRRIDFGGVFHTDGCTDMKWMFYSCQMLESLDVSFLDTSEVTIMQAMFRECKNLEELDVSAFDTSRVTNMAQMFSTCADLEYLDLRTFDTSRVTNMSYMFSACHLLRNVDVTGLDTSKVKDMSGMFNYCNEMEDLKLDWDISSVTAYSNFMVNGKTINGSPWKNYFQ